MIRFPVDDDPVVDLAVGAKGETIKTVLVVNRGPDDVFVAFEDNYPPTAANGFQLKVDDFIWRKIGRGQKIGAICAAGKAASVHVLSDPVE